MEIEIDATSIVNCATRLVVDKCAAMWCDDRWRWFSKMISTCATVWRKKVPEAIVPVLDKVLLGGGNPQLINWQAFAYKMPESIGAVRFSGIRGRA